MARNPVVFQNGTLVSNAKVEVDGTIYDVTSAEYEGSTPLSASNLNQLQTNLYDYIDEKIGNLKGDILWTNTNPTSDFASQDIILNTVQNYDIIGIWVYRNISNEELQEFRIKNGKGADMLFGELYQNVLYIQGRNAHFTSSTTLTFGNGFLHATSGNTTTNDNTRGIPAYIVGYKIGLFN